MVEPVTEDVKAPTPEELRERVATIAGRVADFADANASESAAILRLASVIRSGTKFTDIHTRKDGREEHFEADWLWRLFEAVAISADRLEALEELVSIKDEVIDCFKQACQRYQRHIDAATGTAHPIGEYPKGELMYGTPDGKMYYGEEAEKAMRDPQASAALFRDHHRETE